MREMLQKAHDRYNHLAPMRLYKLKRNGMVISSLIPSSLRGASFKVKDCPICLAMKHKIPPKPRSLPSAEKEQFGLWEKTAVDSSGKFKVASSRGNRYFSVFVDSRSGRKRFYAHRRKSHFPLAFMQFVADIGCFPKILVCDQAGEILSKAMGTTLTVKQVKIVPVAKDEHFSNGQAEKAIQDITYALKTIAAAENLPRNCWDFLGEHICLVNACTSTCPTNPNITIYEAETGEIPNLDAIPRVGVFAIRHGDKLSQKDFKFSPKNDHGVFIGFATLNHVYGSIILTGVNKYVVARHHVEYAHDFRPLAKLSSSNPELKWLHQLLGRENSQLAKHDSLTSQLAIPEDSLASAHDPVQSVDEPTDPVDDGEDSRVTRKKITA